MKAVVRESYDNFSEQVHKKVWVRGVRVSFDRAIINAFYHIPQVDDEPKAKC